MQDNGSCRLGNLGAGGPVAGEGNPILGFVFAIEIC